MKTSIYNLIILDESGSMDCVRRQTIDGCNETINTIKASQEKFGETQDHYVSIFAFQSDGRKPSRYIIKNVPAIDIKHITPDDYEPWGTTPLYDAVGSTLVDLKATVKSEELAIGNVTIITDGMENSSKQYSIEKITRMIDALKEIGWNFSFIGANIDVKGTSRRFHIENSLEFMQDEKGTQEMFAKERSSRMAYHQCLHMDAMETNACMDDSDSDTSLKEKLLRRFKKSSKGYFEKGE